MMKNIVKKMNRGILLTVAILIVVSIYLVATSISQAAEKPTIEQICRDYTASEISYSLLPENWRDSTEPMPQEELDKYLASMETDIAPWYIDNERIRKLALDRIKNDLEYQADSADRILEYTKEIVKFESLSFSGNEVTVVFRSRSAVERSISENTSDTDRTVEETSDTIMLQKIDGEWKLVYANLYQPVRWDTSYKSFY
jgi:hypothetical protein